MVAAMKTTLSTKTTNIIPANFFTLLADLKASLCLRSDWFRSNGLASYSAQLFSFGLSRKEHPKNKFVVVVGDIGGDNQNNN